MMLLLLLLATQACHVGEISTRKDSPLSPQPPASYLDSKMFAMIPHSHNVACRNLPLRRLLDNITSSFAPAFDQLICVLRHTATRCRTVELHVAQHRRRCVFSC